MKKIIYFDPFSGASGDMIIGALLDAGLDFNVFKNELAKLNLPGYEIFAEKKVSKGITGTKFSVKTINDVSHRSLSNILAIIDNSGLKNSVKENSKKIFRRLGESEAKIHNISIEEIHFHEVGAIDSIVDIVGAAIGLDLLGITNVYVNRFHLGKGTVKTAHGLLPVPAPATLDLLKGFPVFSTGIANELVTPTGAAVLTTLAEEVDGCPDMKIHSSGYGAGSRELPIANLLRVIIGETESSQSDLVQLIETNIDDMNPEFYEYVMESLFENGAKDVYFTPIIMKKNRPGIILSVLSDPLQVDKLVDIIFLETTTLGVRISEIKKRRILNRESLEINTEWGKVRVKIRTIDESSKLFSPEYEDCRKIAKEHKIPLQRVYETARKIAEGLF